MMMMSSANMVFSSVECLYYIYIYMVQIHTVYIIIIQYILLKRFIPPPSIHPHSDASLMATKTLDCDYRQLHNKSNINNTKTTLGNVYIVVHVYIYWMHDWRGNRLIAHRYVSWTSVATHPIVMKIRKNKILRMNNQAALQLCRIQHISSHVYGIIWPDRAMQRARRSPQQPTAMLC